MAQRADELADGQPYEFWAQDEARVGLKTVLRRKLCRRGARATALVQHRFQCAYVWGAVRVVGPPDSFFCWSERCNTQTFQQYLDRFAARRPGVLKILQLDNAGWHRSLKVKVPPNVRLLFQPPYSPELNPMETGWQQIKKPLANRNADTRQQLVGWLDDAIDDARRTGRLASATQFASLQLAFNQSNLVVR